MTRKVTLDPTLAKTLDATGKPWRAERGGKHIKRYVEDHLVGVVSNDGKFKGEHNRRNLLASIRRNASAGGRHD